MMRIMIYPVFRLLAFDTEILMLTRVEVPRQAGKIATRNLDRDSMARPKRISNWPQLKLKGVNLPRLCQTRLVNALPVPQPDNAIV